MEVTSGLNIRIYQIEDKTILAIIKINPRCIKYHRNTSAQKTYEWMHVENWTAFEEGLGEAVLRDRKVYIKENWEYSFNIDRNINVSVNTSKVSARQLGRFLQIKQINDNICTVALDCVLNYKEEQTEQLDSANTPKSEELDDFVGYNELQNEYDPVHAATSVKPIVPYIPSSKTERKICSYETDDESYTPQPVADTSNELITQTPSPVPIYKAAPNDTSKRKKRKKKSEAEKLVDSLTHKNHLAIPTKRDAFKKSYNEDINFTENNNLNKSRRKPTNAKPKLIKTTKTSDESTQLEPSTNRKRRVITKSLTFQSRQSSKKKNNNKAITKSLETTSTAFIPSSNGNKNKYKHSELFGSDEDEEQESQIFTTIESKLPQSTTKSKRKLHDIASSSDFENDKSKNCSWLSKKSANRNDTGKQQKVSSSNKHIVPKPEISPLRAIANQTKEDLEAQRQRDLVKLEENRKIQKELDDLCLPPPAKVEPLTLDDVSEADILQSFNKFKPKLDLIFKKEKTKSYVRSWEGVNHFLVMNLTERDTQMKIMQKLSEVYESNLAGPSAYTTLFANAMMPEWLVSILMEKHKLTRTEAIKHLEAVENYRIYVESQKEQAFPFS